MINGSTLRILKRILGTSEEQSTYKKGQRSSDYHFISPACITSRFEKGQGEEATVNQSQEKCRNEG